MAKVSQRALWVFDKPEMPCDENARQRTREDDVESRPAARWELVRRALENERQLDVRFRQKVADEVDDSVPDYKVMKQLALRHQLGALYRPFIQIAPLATVATAPLQWTAALIQAVIPSKAPQAMGTVHLLPTAMTNLAMIRAAVESDPALKGRPIHVLPAGTIAVARALGVTDVLGAIIEHVRLLSSLVSHPSRRDLLLHSLDAPILLLLARYLEAHPDDVFVTECHYQRWSFLLSSCAGDARIVQHGTLDDAIDLAHAPGPLKAVYVQNVPDAAQFDRYYQVLSVRVFEHLPQLDDNPYRSSGAFLASSFPFIDDEIELLQRLKAAGVPTLVKLHPAHRYDGRKKTLLSLASHACGPNEHPACAVFVSHSSSMEGEYRARGIPAVSIARAGSAERACAELLALLRKKGTTSLAVTDEQR